MIIDMISNIGLYKGINNNLDKVIEFIKNTDFNKYEFGDHKIDDDNFFKKLNQECFKIEDAPYEVHKIFADIHFIIDGKSEKVGYLENQKVISGNEVSCGEDVTFYKNDIKNVVDLNHDKFVLFIPGEGHAPKIKNGYDKVTKIICKVKW